VKKYGRIGSMAVAALALLIAGLMIGSGVQAAGGGTQPTPKHVTDQAPYHITIHGKLNTTTRLTLPSPVSVTFNLYDVPTGGTAFFTEKALITPQPDGTFIYDLGTNASLTMRSAYSNPIYLGITPAGGSEQQPRQPLAGAAYAMSLVPGAQIIGDSSFNGTLLDVEANAGYSIAVNGTGSFIGVSGITSRAGASGSVGVAGWATTVNGIGAGGIGEGANGIGVLGDACWQAQPCQPTAIGGVFRDYNDRPDAVGMQVMGIGQATGGFVTGGSYGMMVRYHGNAPLHGGDILALDGNNETFANGPLFGTVKADASNAGAAIGVATNRYMVITAAAPAAGAPKPFTPPGEQRVQVDEAATTFQQGDLVEIVVVGQAQMKVSGKVKLGDRLAVGSDGSIVVAAKDSSDSIGKVAGKPDANGIVSVFVNFK
jgi:hypothetical protein